MGVSLKQVILALVVVAICVAGIAVGCTGTPTETRLGEARKLCRDTDGSRCVPLALQPGSLYQPEPIRQTTSLTSSLDGKEALPSAADMANVDRGQSRQCPQRSGTVDQRCMASRLATLLASLLWNLSG